MRRNYVTWLVASHEANSNVITKQLLAPSERETSDWLATRLAMAALDCDSLIKNHGRKKDKTQRVALLTTVKLAVFSDISSKVKTAARWFEGETR